MSCLAKLYAISGVLFIGDGVGSLRSKVVFARSEGVEFGGRDFGSWLGGGEDEGEDAVVRSEVTVDQQ
jgi:hypothetical protein